jgi:DNA-binding ferritin-like protein
MQEQAMWIVANILRKEASSVDHTWQARIRNLSEESRQIAQELRDHNEQFEEEDDE